MKLTTRMLGQLDRQDVFDIVAWHLLRQGTRATAFDGVKCLYRAPDGKRCAIGWLIPDEVYSKALEFLGVRDLAERLIESEHAAFARFLYRHMPLLRSLQEMHDASVPAEWPVMLHTIAKMNGLNTTVLTHCERQLGYMLPVKREPVARPVAPAYLLDLKKIEPFYGVDHGREEREEAREVCCA